MALEYEGPHREFHVYMRENNQYAPPKEKRGFPLSRQWCSASSWAEFTPELALQSVQARSARALLHAEILSVDIEILHQRCIKCRDGKRVDRRGRATKHDCSCVTLGGPLGDRVEFTIEKSQ